MSRTLISLMIVTVFTVLSTQAMAAKGRGAAIGGDSAIGLGIMSLSAEQSDLNYVADQINASTAGAAKTMGSALEFYVQYVLRFSGSMFSLVFRPSYMSQEGSGSTTTSKITAYTIFPLLRMTPLENSFIKFYLQGGVGYGQASGVLSNSGGKISYNGGAFGAIAGLGAEFCFTANHCMNIEGNARYLPIQRSVVDSGSGSITGISQGSTGRELEINNNDAQVTLSGIQGLIGYTYNF